MNLRIYAFIPACALSAAAQLHSSGLRAQRTAAMAMATHWPDAMTDM
jgi:hypothetical protein